MKDRIRNFNSRPHGGRRDSEALRPEKKISTHALTEGDPVTCHDPAARIHFNSRPHGGRPKAGGFASVFSISTHALTEGDGVEQDL